MDKKLKLMDYDQLCVAAKEAAERAYAPYSQFRVGAALLTNDGSVVAGCNVENASYGLTLCAERNAITTAVAQGYQNFETVLVYTELSHVVPPCGACRQVIAEFMSPDAEVVLVSEAGLIERWTVSELLPAAFTPAQLQE